MAGTERFRINVSNAFANVVKYKHSKERKTFWSRISLTKLYTVYVAVGKQRDTNRKSEVLLKDQRRLFAVNGLYSIFYDWKHGRAKLNLRKENCHMRPAKRLPLQRLNLQNSTITQFKVTQVLVHQPVTFTQWFMII